MLPGKGGFYPKLGSNQLWKTDSSSGCVIQLGVTELLRKYYVAEGLFLSEFETRSFLTGRIS
jgi:hypothetical protein